MPAVEQPSPYPAAGLASTLLALGKYADLFQYPRSAASDLESVAKDKDLEIWPADRNSDDNDEFLLANTQPDRLGVESWMVQTPAQRLAVISRENNNLWVNVSDLGEGFSGSRVYDLAANFAQNNRLIFIGDPAGVSEAALRRRLENMLSSAVKYGTTDHVAPHPDQIEGASDKGIAPLVWTPGDTLANIAALVSSSLATTTAAAPAASTVSFDASSGLFLDADGTPLHGDDFVRLLGDAVERGAARAGRPGNSTLQRAALFRTLLQGPDARRAVLDAVRGKQGAGGAGLGGSFY